MCCHRYECLIVLNLLYFIFVIIVECVVAEKCPRNAVRAVRMPASYASVV